MIPSVCRFPFALLLLAVCLSPHVAEGGPLLDRVLNRKQPRLTAVRAGRFLVITDHEFDRAAEIARELNGLGRELQKDLELPLPEELTRIYVFQTHDTYSRYVRKHIPYLDRFDTRRNSIYLLRNGNPYIFAVNNNWLSASLRHEYVHVVLNNFVKGTPVWLDEGLAMYYEAATPGSPHVDLLHLLDKKLRGGWQPDLERLERLKKMQQMGPLEYAEAWIWADYLLDGPEEKRSLIKGYVNDLKTASAETNLSSRLRMQKAQLQASWQKHFDEVISSRLRTVSKEK